MSKVIIVVSDISIEVRGPRGKKYEVVELIDQRTSKPTAKAKATPKAAKAKQSLVCVRCGKPISRTVRRISHDRYGKPLCVACQKEAQAKMPACACCGASVTAGVIRYCRDQGMAVLCMNCQAKARRGRLDTRPSGSASTQANDSTPSQTPLLPQGEKVEPTLPTGAFPSPVEVEDLEGITLPQAAVEALQ